MGRREGVHRMRRRGRRGHPQGFIERSINLRACFQKKGKRKVEE
jgi:hypothetical protein